MPRRENTFRVDYSQFPRQLSHEEIHKFVGKELGLTRENVCLLQPSKRLGCTFVEVNNLELAERIVRDHDNKHEFVFDGKTYKLRILMEDGAVEVRLFDLSNDVSNVHIAEFLAEYGDVLHIRDLLWDERSAFGGVKTGVRIARMVVKKNIPSLVTIRGEDTAVGYRGQRQTCVHCHEFVHVGIPCVQNKKLLAQKLVADQSYANVAKQPALSKSNNPIPQPQHLNAKQHENRASPQLNTMPPPTNKQPPRTLPITPISSIPTTIGSLSTLRKTDENDTDSSQASCSSTSTRRLRSKRSPPGKKMRHNNEVNSEHGRGSGEEMQQ